MSSSNKSNNVGKRLRQSSLLDTFSFLKKKKLSSDSDTIMSGEASREVTKGAMLTCAVSSKGNESSSHEDLLGDKYESGSASCSKNNLSDAKNEREDCNNSDVSNTSIDIFSEPASPQTLDVANSNQNTISNISKPQIAIVNLPLNRIPHCSKPLPTLWSSSEHLVLFNCNSTLGAPVRPYPINYKDAWDNKHVRLPCSPASLYPVKNQETGDEEILSRWEIIEKSLLSPISSSFDLQDAILAYNSQYSTRWNFQDLHKFFTDILEPEENTAFFEHLLPKMIRLALRMPELCTNPMPLLRKDYNQSITMSQSQIGCLLANAFFCTYPRRNSQNRNTEYASYPDINFNRLFVNSQISYRSEKFKCLFNYFKRITSNEPVGIVTFERRHSRFTPRWIESNRKLTNLYMRNEGTIEKEGVGLLQVDFANKFVGGGVLGHGCVQEEIRFLICPELIVSRLFTECLNENEVLVITGCEQYNSYSGYSDTFKWEGDFRDETPRDSWGRRCTQLLAMDALHFRSKKVQYEAKMLFRELNKAFSGFYEPTSKDNLSAIATGNWGCGAFNGEARLKILLQLLAASEADRDLVYFTFSDENLMSDAEALYDYLVQRDMTVSKLFKILLDYSKYLVTEGPHKTLYAFIYDHDGEGASDCTLDLDSNDLEDFC